MALDIGQKRIGVARAQSRARIVEPLEIINVAGGNEFLRLKELLVEWRPAILVIGLPLNATGGLGAQAELIKEWVCVMVAETQFKGRIVYQDETLSSHQARSNRSRSRFVDDAAAAVILQDYLN